MSSENRWGNVKNILCVRLDSLGDVLMTSPALRALKEGGPGRKITLLTSQSGSAIARFIPSVDRTIVYDPPWMKSSQPPEDSQPEIRMIECLKKSCFEAAVIFTTFSQSPLPAALMAFLADIPLRLAHCRENPYHLLTDWVPESDQFSQEQIRHEVRRQLDLVETVGATTSDETLALQLSTQSLETVQHRLAQIGLNIHKPWLVMHPGATAPSRRYPARGFAEAARVLVYEHGFQVLFTGTTPEAGLVESIRADMHTESFSLLGKLDIQEFSALLSIAPVLISNNTGPVHIAAAFHTPVVDLYALTNPQHTPWQTPHWTLYHDVPCKFCYKSICPMGHHNCLRLIPPTLVVTTALNLLEQGKHPAATTYTFKQ